jgi:hypothetical protein
MKRVIGLVCLASVVILATFAQQATGTHIRPKAATPKYDPFVISYADCTLPNTQHGAPLAFPSCNPPGPTTHGTSQYLTVGTPDNNAAQANSTAFQRIQLCGPVGFTGCPANDVGITFWDRDVRCVGTAVSAPLCPQGNSVPGPPVTPTPADYAGRVLVQFTVRMTDHANTSPTTGTVQDWLFLYPVQCSPTASVATGSDCPAGSSLQTSMNAVFPGFPSSELNKRANMQIRDVQVLDGGPNGDLPNVTYIDDTKFQSSGIFIP